MAAVIWILACLAVMVTTCSAETEPALASTNNGWPRFTRKRAFECFEWQSDYKSEKLELRCDADGTPKPNITWSKFGSAIERGAAAANVEFSEWSIVVNDFSQEDFIHGVVYQCRVCNVVGCIEFTYLIGPKKSIETALVDSRFETRVRDVDEDNATWWKIDPHCYAFVLDDSGGISVERRRGITFTETVLTFERIAYADSGLYVFGAERSYYLELEVKHHDREVKSDDHKFVQKKAGENVTLKCAWRTARITWTKNDEEIARTSELKLANLSFSDNGLYRCEFCYEAECREHYFILVVDTIFKEDSVQNKSVQRYGEQVVLSCGNFLADYNIKHTVVWYFTKPNKQTVLSNGTNETFVKSTVWRDSWITCEVTSEYGIYTRSAYLKKSWDNETLIVDPRMKYFEIIENEGSPVSMQCNAVGIPKPNCSWIKEGATIEPNLLIEFSNNSCSFTISNVTRNNSGEYLCRACNTNGCYERPYWLLVGSLVDESTQNTSVVLNSETSLMCVDKYYPFIKRIEWEQYDGKIRTKKFPGIHYVKSLNKLHFPKVQHKDEGWYTCKIYLHDAGSKAFPKYFNLRIINNQPVTSKLLTISISVVIVVIGLTTIVAACIRKINAKQADKITYWTKKVIVIKQPQYQEASKAIQMPIVRIEEQRRKTSRKDDPHLNYEFPVDWEWELPRNRLILGTVLGEGAFGKVLKAEAYGLNEDSSTPTTVAVKMLKEDHSEDDMKDFVCEIEILKMIGNHPNIINLHGCCSANGPLLAVVEFALHGNLKDFLRADRHEEKASKVFPVQQLISFASQIARGMEYLASRKCIHRDLAARNVLVAAGYAMKISDFGLARDVLDYEYYRKQTPGKLPVRWMAPESVEQRFYNSQTDVWSFGVLLWEIMTLGDFPYAGWENFFEQVKRGERLNQPNLCPGKVYKLMAACWHIKADKRPTFGEIVRGLEEMIGGAVSNAEYLDGMLRNENYEE